MSELLIRLDLIGDMVDDYIIDENMPDEAHELLLSARQKLYEAYSVILQSEIKAN